MCRQSVLIGIGAVFCIGAAPEAFSGSAVPAPPLIYARPPLCDNAEGFLLCCLQLACKVSFILSVNSLQIRSAC